MFRLNTHAHRLTVATVLAERSGRKKRNRVKARQNSASRDGHS